MQVYNTKGVIMYPLALFALLILLNGYCCGAAVLVESNTTHTFQCDGRLDECLIEDDLELEFLMNPYVSRVLAEASINALDGNHKAFPCGNPNDTPPSYHQCTGTKTGGNNKGNCSGSNAYCR